MTSNLGAPFLSQRHPNVAAAHRPATPTDKQPGWGAGQWPISHRPRLDLVSGYWSTLKR